MVMLGKRTPWVVDCASKTADAAGVAPIPTLPENTGDAEKTRFVLVVPVAPVAVKPVILLNDPMLAVDALVPPLATLSNPESVTAPVAGVAGVRPVVPPDQDDTPALASVMVPEPLVMLMPTPGVSVLSVYPTALPMSS